MLNSWVVWLHKSNEDMKYRQFFDDPNAKYKGFICMFMLKEFPYLFICDFFLHKISFALKAYMCMNQQL